MLQLYESALAIFEQNGHISYTAMVRHNMAVFYYEQERYTESEALYQYVLTIMEQTRDPVHRDIAWILDNLGELYVTQQKFELALPLYERALAIWEQIVGSNSPDTALALYHLADCRTKRQEYAIALPLYERTLTILEQSSGSDALQIADILEHMASCLIALGAPQQAETHRQRALQIRKKRLPPEDSDTD